jgi:hypothetical protein
MRHTDLVKLLRSKADVDAQDQDGLIITSEQLSAGSRPILSASKGVSVVPVGVSLIFGDENIIATQEVDFKAVSSI